METDYITRKEHEEYGRRLEEENSRQSEMLHLIKKSVKDILIPMQASVEKPTMNILKELRSQGKRLEALDTIAIRQNKNASSVRQ